MPEYESLEVVDEENNNIDLQRVEAVHLYRWAK